MTFHKLAGLIAAALVLAAPLAAASSVGWATASQPIQISGVSVPAGAGPAPLSPGDKIVAGPGPVLLVLPGLGSIAFENHSAVKIEQSGDVLAVRLVQGSLFYDLAPEAKIAVFDGSRQVSTQDARAGKVESSSRAAQSDTDFPPRVRGEPISDPRFRPPSPSQP